MIWEIAYTCGCKFAIYKKTVEIKICRKHYKQLKNASIETVLSANLRISPEDIPKLQELINKTMSVKTTKG